MIFHHFHLSWRSLIKNRAYALLNVGGLAIGIVVAMFVGCLPNARPSTVEPM
jgi:putative ABC transport system permease protein